MGDDYLGLRYNVNMQLTIDVPDSDASLLPYYAQMADANITDLTDPTAIINAVATAFETKLRAQAVQLAAQDAADKARLQALGQYNG